MSEAEEVRSNDPQVLAVKALERIAAHERICSVRWNFVTRLGFLITGKLLLVLGVLFYMAFGPGP